jgi:RNA recognition motif-containing protein
MARKLFLGNLEWGVRDGDLRSLLDSLGVAYEKVDVVLDQNTGRSRGFAFVHFSTDDDTTRARVALEGADLAGRAIHVEDAVERPRGGRRDGGGGGGRDRGGRDKSDLNRRYGREGGSRRRQDDWR